MAKGDAIFALEKTPMDILKIKSAPNGSISQDGNQITAQFILIDGKKVEAHFETTDLEHVMRNLSGLLSTALNKQNKGEGPDIVSMLTPRGFRASSTDARGTLVLSAEMPNGLEYAFSFPAELVDQFCNALRKAAEENKRIAPTMMQ